MNGKPFLDGGKGKVFQFSTNVSVDWELLNPGPGPTKLGSIALQLTL